MSETPANSNMSRSTAEALKLIQKQGLSISIVGGDNSKTFPSEAAAKETRDKQNPVVVENISSPRTAISSDNKQTASQSSRITPNVSTETRTSSAQSVLPPNQTVQTSSVKSNPSVSTSETKVQNSQRINSTNTVENKSQFLSSTRSGQTDKLPANIGHVSQNTLFPEKKTQPRNIQNIPNTSTRNNQTELKGQAILTRTQNQSLASENKNSIQSRLPASSEALDGKTLNNQGRSSQNCFSPAHDKSIGGQRSKIQITEIKAPNSQCKVIPIKISDKPGAIKSSQNVKLVQAVRPISQYYPNTTASNVMNASKTVEKSANSISERSLTNPFRVASTLVKNSSEDKMPKITRVTNVIPENQSKISQQAPMKAENKTANQGVTISELSSELHQKPHSPENSPELLSPRVNTMPIQKGGVKRVALATSTPLGKRKCVKLLSSPIIDSQSDLNALSSDESPIKEKSVFKLKNLTPGLTITPIRSSISTPSTSGVMKKVGESNTTQNLIVICPTCKQCSFNLTSCDSCHQKFTTTPVRYQYKTQAADSASIVVTENVTTSIEKSMQIVYHLPAGTGPNQSFQFQQSQQVIKVSPRKGRPKRRKFAEPVCYTLSSDDEDGIPFDSFHQVDDGSQMMYPADYEGSKSEQSSTSDIMQDENQEFDEYPGVTSINSRQNLNDEDEEEEDEEEDLEQGMESEEELMDEEEHHEFDEEELEEEEEEEDDEIPPDEEDRTVLHNKISLTQSGNMVLKCRSIRIGSYKIHPEQHTNNIDVTLTDKSISFPAPPFNQDGKKCIILTLKAAETAQMWVHFGKCLPIIFAYTSRNFGEAVRKALNMTRPNQMLFDPTSDDMKKNKITFLIDYLTDDQKSFMRHIFPGQEKLKEIDQKEANEILVKSTPQHHLVKLESSDSTVAISPLNLPAMTGVIPAALASQSLSITKVVVKPAPVPSVPVTKILTYPPPPSTGGVAINTADLATLEEGEFLNDAILDFYLKYVFYEKLSARDRETTHIFSSFFYPRLTQKPDRQRPGDDGPKTMQVRRHNQVKTWTKNIDIFSKDYIVIPVNQHNHWFLAFICYPGNVPETPVVKDEPQSVDNVSSTDDQEDKDTSKDEINTEEMQNQDENSTNSNSLYEVEEPPDSEEELQSEVASSNVQDDNNIIFHDNNHQRKETPCILIFDSLSGPNRWRIASTLREYLEMEWKIRKGTKKVFDRNTMQGFIVKCPQQTNFSDCGLYVLQYVESFFENPIPYFANPMPDLTNWFSDVRISKKRQQLKELILNLQKKYQIKQSVTIKKSSQSSVSSPVVSTSSSDNR